MTVTVMMMIMMLMMVLVMIAMVIIVICLNYFVWGNFLAFYNSLTRIMSLKKFKISTVYKRLFCFVDDDDCGDINIDDDACHFMAKLSKQKL